MNIPEEPNDQEQAAADEAFAELVADMGDLGFVDDHAGFETVRIELPGAEGQHRPMVLTLEAPSAMAQLIRAEFSPQRVAAMVRTIQTLSELAEPPGR